MSSSPLIASILIVTCLGHFVLTQKTSYRHYSRHSQTETHYENQTIPQHEDDSNMCHLSVRCPAIPTLCKFDLLLIDE